MKYEGSIGFFRSKMKNFFCLFSLFRTYYGLKTRFEQKKNFRLSRAVAAAAAAAVH
jgi:hypothetical protein